MRPISPYAVQSVAVNQIYRKSVKNNYRCFHIQMEEDIFFQSSFAKQIVEIENNKEKFCIMVI